MAPPVLVATAGAANANCYIVLADAETYFTMRTNATWTASVPTADEKTAALEVATAMLDRLRWKGIKGSTTATALTQALAWPRRWAPTLEYDAPPDFLTDYFVDVTVGYYASTTIPDPIAHATCELALEILKAGTTDIFAAESEPDRDILLKRVDVLETQFVAWPLRQRGLTRFPNVYALIAPLLRDAGAPEIQRA